MSVEIDTGSSIALVRWLGLYSSGVQHSNVDYELVYRMCIMSEGYVIHKIGDVVAEYLKLRGGWVLAHIDQTIGWPLKDMIVEYEGRELILLTYDDARQLIPAVGVWCKPGWDEVAARQVITSFLSALNWVSHGSI